MDRVLGLRREGMRWAEEALELFNQLGNSLGQATCLGTLALSLLEDNQLDAAEDIALCKLGLLPKKGREYLLCQSHHLLGIIYRRKGQKEKAISHSRRP